MARLSEQHGIALLEILVSVFVVSLVLIPLVTFTSGQARFLEGLEERTGADQVVRLVVDSISRDLREAGFDGLGHGVEAFVAAGSTYMILHHDGDGDGTIENRSRERIGYAFQPETGTLSRVVGRQSMPLAKGLPFDGFWLRFADDKGASLSGSAGVLELAERRAIRLVRIGVLVRDEGGTQLAGAETAIAIRNVPWR